MYGPVFLRHSVVVECTWCRWRQRRLVRRLLSAYSRSDNAASYDNWTASTIRLLHALLLPSRASMHYQSVTNNASASGLRVLRKLRVIHGPVLGLVCGPPDPYRPPNSVALCKTSYFSRLVFLSLSAKNHWSQIQITSRRPVDIKLSK